ncbi:MAG TPA: PTS sugar transporter subunit IIC [Bacillota bacterium]|nr:PTS sugar transporter subunit IIC [Bacillota bacterium]
MDLPKTSKTLDYVTKALNGMALGLFSSLIIGLILKQIGEYSGIAALVTFGTAAQYMMGPAIGAGVAYTLKAPPLGVFACLAAGALGAGTFSTSATGALVVRAGEPVGALIAALAGTEASRFLQGRTKVDIVLVPAGTIILGGLAGVLVGPVMASFMAGLGQLINSATELHPLPMGIIVAILMGMILTLPISSAALAISLGLSGLAAGASVAGCAANMIGFAVASYRDNGINGLLAQGLGTSMLQIPNIVKKPIIWLPAIVASAVAGPISTVLLQMKSNSVGAGMGTSGLVGQFGTVAAMTGQEPTMSILGKIGFLHFLLPAVLAGAVAWAMRKRGLIKDGDMKLDV